MFSLLSSRTNRVIYAGQRGVQVFSGGFFCERKSGPKFGSKVEAKFKFWFSLAGHRESVLHSAP